MTRVARWFTVAFLVALVAFPATPVATVTEVRAPVAVALAGIEYGPEV